MERIEVKLAADGVDAKTGEFAGYGAVFGNVDSYGDVIEAGAFKATLREWEERGKFPPMLLQHGAMGASADDMLPVGQWTAMAENSKGLKVEGKLFALATERGQYLYDGLKAGVLDGLSIGYRARKWTSRTKPDEPRRKLEDVDLMEVSIVTFPANPKARVRAVKSVAPMTAEEKREIEAILRTQGFSRAEAAKAVSCFCEWSQRDAGNVEPDPRDEGAEALADLIRRNIATLSK